MATDSKAILTLVFDRDRMLAQRHGDSVPELVANRSAAQQSPELDELVEGVFETGKNASEYIAITSADGATQTYQATAFELADQPFVCVNLISKRLASIATEGQAADMQSAFLANMNHEIRTPLNGMIGMIDLLEETSLNEDQGEMLSAIRSSGGTLMALINDILDLSKIEAGKIEIESIPFSPSDCINSCVFLLKNKAVQRSISIDSVIDPSVPKIAVGDASRLRQIVLNLVNNALKFTLKGSIDVLARAQSIDDKSVELTISVTDTGIGVEEDNLNRLFKPFSQVDASISRRFGGSGLGLAICKNLVELMGGSIQVESQPNKGSKFWFTIPLEVSQDSLETDSAATPSRPLNQPYPISILVVEDNYANLKTISAMLDRFGYEPDSAGNGREGVERFGSEGYDVILMDMHMPIMTGLEATREIRSSVAPAKQPWIVGISAGTMRAEQDLAYQAGIDDFLCKPIDMSMLQDNLRRAHEGLVERRQRPKPA
ncbi:MAG: hypothetical protein CBD18_07315 [Opitutales bacterium TMED158]|nr:MAG: hypothetical protein CBD18_07315 [Opitutales bacterium TMED158]